MKIHTYRLDASWMLETGYTRDQIQRVADAIETAHPTVSVEIDWRGPVSTSWLGDGSPDSDDLHVEVLHTREAAIRDIDACTVQSYLDEHDLTTANVEYLEWPVSHVTYGDEDTVRIWITGNHYVIARPISE